MPRKSRTRYSILGCLTVEPQSGYDIKRFLERTVAHFWSESYGQLYPTLGTLEEEGLIEGRDVPGERGQDKRVYAITERGREALSGWLTEPPEPVRPRYEHSLKLFFGFNVPPAVSLGHIEAVRKEAAADLQAYRDAEARLAPKAQAEPTSPAPYWLAVLRGGIRYSEMMLEWCEETEALLTGLPDASQGAGAGRAGGRGKA